MRRSLLAVTYALTLAGGTGQARAAAYTFSGVNLPGATATGINDLGQIAGTVSTAFVNPALQQSGFTFNGFLDNAGAFTTILAQPIQGIFDGTTIAGINNNGQIIGSFGVNGLGGGFVYANGGFTFLPNSSPSGLFGTYDAFRPLSTNDAGVILGQVSNFGPGAGNNVFGGFGGKSLLYSNGTYTNITIPNETNVAATGINNAGEIVGQYNAVTSSASINVTGQGFLDNAGVISLVRVPGAIAGTTDPIVINNLGVIAGTYADAAGSHVFVDDNNVFSTVDGLPTGTLFPYTVTGINDAGVLALSGPYDTPFLATPVAAVAVPEPGSATLLSIGVGVLGIAIRRRKGA